MSFRHGQCVTFDLTPDLDPIKNDIFITPEGKGVGVFHGASRLSMVVSVDGTTPVSKETVYPMDKEGRNIIKLVGMEVVKAELDPRKLVNLTGAKHRDEIPPARISHLPADWQPTP